MLEDRQRTGEGTSFLERKHLFGFSVYRMAIALSASTLLFIGQLRSWTSEQNRYHYFWQFKDSLALLLSVGILFCIILLLSNLVLRIKKAWLKDFARFIFILFVGDAVLSGLTSMFVGVGFTAKYDWFFWFGWGLIAIVAFWQRERLWRPICNLCLILSPLPVILIPQVLTWSAWYPDPRSEGSLAKPLNRVQGDKLGTPRRIPIVVFVFDEWSYSRTFSKGQVRQEFRNIEKVAEQAIVFHGARSPGSATLVSLPRLIFGEKEGAIRPNNGKLTWLKEGKETAISQLETIFDGALARGYRVRLLGFYHPYPRLLEGRPIECKAYPNDPKFSNVLAQAAWFWIVNLRFLTDPISRWLWRYCDSQLFSQHWYDFSQRFRNDVFYSIEDIGDGDLLFIHWPLPHGPFILDDGWRYVGPYPMNRDRTWGTPADYHRHLLLLDRVIALICNRLQERGVFDQALIVMTSDHSWRRDPEEGEGKTGQDRRHVPLLVKLPRQAERVDRYDPVDVTIIREIIQAVLDNRPLPWSRHAES